MKTVASSQSDHWNNLLFNQAAQSLWIKNSKTETHRRQLRAAAAALAGIGPRDELEGMMATQSIAAHNAVMECHRRAMLVGQDLRVVARENLNQANRLSRTWTTLLGALDKPRGKGRQKVTVEHVYVHAGGQAVVGMVETQGGIARNRRNNPLHSTCSCTGARNAEPGRGA